MYTYENKNKIVWATNRFKVVALYCEYAIFWMLCYSAVCGKTNEFFKMTTTDSCFSIHAIVKNVIIFGLPKCSMQNYCKRSI